jgi:hypothetical protein
MKEAELRLFIRLRILTRDRPNHTITISTVKLGQTFSPPMAQSAVRRALRDLSQRNYITVRQATPTRPTVIQVNAFEIARFPTQPGAVGVPLRGTPPQENLCLQEAHPMPTRGTPVPFGGTPPTENTALARAALASDFDVATLRLIDQILSAKSKNLEREEIEEARRWMQGYMARFGRDEDNRPYDLEHAPHPPHDDLVAQFLTAAGPKAFRLLQELFNERKQCYSYAWFVTVALQRCAGLRWEKQKQARTILQDVKRTKRQSQAEQLTIYDDADAGDLRAVVAAVAGAKKLR